MGIDVFLNPDTERRSTALASRTWAPLHHHRLEAIRALNNELQDPKLRLRDETFLSIGLMLDVEVRER